MNITAHDVWDLVNIDPRETAGTTGSQRRAFRLLLITDGGVGFIASRPAAELEELGRRGVCSANLRMILRHLAHVEVKARRVLRDLASLKLEHGSLMQEAADPGDPKMSLTNCDQPCSNNPARTTAVKCSEHAPAKRPKERSRNR